MAVCDFDMRFTFVVTGWAGSAHDTWVFFDTLVTYNDKFPYPPQGKYYIVDFGYLNRKGYLAHYKRKVSCARMATWLPSSGIEGGVQLTMLVHPFRNVIEWSFGVFKMRWCILLQLLSYLT